MKNEKNYLLGIYTRSPLHVGAGTSVDIVDLPIIRERITNYPLIPASALKGVLRQEAVDLLGKNNEEVNILFGNRDDETAKDVSYGGAMFFGEAKLIAFPVRSLKGCFAWITCPLALQRFSRDMNLSLKIPKIETDCCFAPDFVTSDNTAVLEEYPLAAADKTVYGQEKEKINLIISELKKISDDTVWVNELENRLVITSDENFQHFVSTTTEIIARIAIDPKTRTNTGLFNQENAPSETVYYSVCRFLGERKGKKENTACNTFEKLFPQNKAYIQLGGNETIGQGLCEVKLTALDGGSSNE